jgi:hypothetical protein
MTSAKIFWCLAGAFGALAIVCSTIDVAPQMQVRLACGLFAALAATAACAFLALASRRSPVLQQAWVARTVAWTAAIVTLLFLVTSLEFVV